MTGFVSIFRKKDAFKKIDLPAEKNKNNLFVNSLLEDPSRQCIWLVLKVVCFVISPLRMGIDGVDFFKKTRLNRLLLMPKKIYCWGLTMGFMSMTRRINLCST